jgi:N-acetylglucosamine-6-sulfatase
MRIHTRLTVLAAAGALLVTALGAGAVDRAPAADAAAAAAVVGPNSPNILLVNLDDARYDALQHMPQTRSWLYPTGRRFLSHRVVIPSCCPSRSALFTGRYPHNNGVRLQTQALSLDRNRTLMRYLKDAGYRTAMAGKFLVSWPGPTRPPHFDRWTSITEGYYGFTAWADSATPRTVPGYSTHFLGRQLRSYLTAFEGTDATPWFAYYAPQAPHVESGWKTLATPETKYADTPVPSCVRPGEADRSDKPAYLGLVRWDAPYVRALCRSQIRALWSVDDQLARIFTQLRQTRELANTLVMVTSDNGYHWGEQYWFTKMTPYEPSMLVPMVVRWDGQVPAGTTTRRMTSSIDVLPTVLGILGRQPLVPVDGRSMLSGPGRARYFAEYFIDIESNGDQPTFASLTTPTRKYVESQVRNPNGTTSVFRELYRLDSDPGELVNILRDDNPANDPSAAELTRWATQLAAGRRCAGTGCP